MADLELWLEYASAITYADHTSTGITAKPKAELIAKLEKDAMNVLRYMASNGLVANPNKTAFAGLNQPNVSISESPLKVKIGDVIISQESSAKLFGIV